MAPHDRRAPFSEEIRNSYLTESGPLLADRETTPRHGRMWWAVTGIMVVFVMVIIGGGILASCSPQSGYPPAPSTWDGASAAIYSATPAPNPFPWNFEEFVYLAKGGPSNRDYGWEGKSCDEQPHHCQFVGPALTMTVNVDDDRSIHYIEFELDRYQMAAAARTFNQFVWDTGLEKPAEAARQFVDKRDSLDVYYIETVDGIDVNVTFRSWVGSDGSYGDYLIIWFSD